MHMQCIIDLSRLTDTVPKLAKIAGKCDYVCIIAAPKPHLFRVFAVFNFTSEGEGQSKQDDDSLYLIGSCDNYATQPIPVHWDVSCAEPGQILFYLDGENRNSARPQIKDLGEHQFWIKPHSTTAGPVSPSMIRLRVLRRKWKGSRQIPICIRLIVGGQDSKPQYLYVGPPRMDDTAAQSSLEPIEASILRGIEKISLRNYQVVGEYYRFRPETRKLLRDLVGRIRAQLNTRTRARANYLIWAEPGSGKTALIRETATSSRVQFVEVNLATMEESEFVKNIQLACQSNRPTLCLIDEVDARQDERWPYERCFSKLEANQERRNPLVFVLVGSTSGGITEMCRQITSRVKGPDLLSRIFNPDAGYVIPALEPEDRVLIFCSKVVAHSQTSSVFVDQIDKTALYYLLRKDSFRHPRQLDEMAGRAVTRLHKNDHTLCYSHLFHASNYEQYDFWCQNSPTMQELSATSVVID